MFNPERTLIICKTSSEYTEFSNLEVEYLFRTLIEFGGKLAKCKKIAYFNKGKIKSEISRKLSDLGVTIKFVEPLDEFYPFYKTALLEEVASEDFDNLIMLDSDVIVTGDFSDQIEEVIRAKPEDIDPLSTNQWMSLFNYFKLEMPTERYKTSAMCGETTTYFNVGVILVPKKYLKTLSRKWKTYGKKLFKEKLPSGISEHSRYFEQISLTLALVDTKLPFKPLSIEMNYPYIGYINNFEKPENLKPLLIHHHHCITETGHIMYCPYTNINRIVDQVNDYLTKGKDIRIADEKIKKANFTIRNLVHLEQYQEVINRISELPTNSDNAEMQYYLALSLHMTGQRLEEAIERYTTALEKGFLPFWIYYNRGSLYYRIGNIEKAENDLNKALEIDPRHVGAIEVLDLINKEKKSSQNYSN